MDSERKDYDQRKEVSMTLPPPGQDDGGEGFEVEERLRMGGDGTQCVGALQHWGCIRYSASWKKHKRKV